MLSRLVLILLFPAIAWAEPVTWPQDKDLAVVCYARGSSLWIFSPSRLNALNEHLKTYRGGSEKPEFFEFYSSERFVKRSKDGFRTGSTRTTRKCGDVVIAISAAFANSNPDGADGVYVFPTVAFGYDKKLLTKPTVISDECDANQPRFGTCSTDYATEVNAFGEAPGTYYINYLRQFQDGQSFTLTNRSSGPAKASLSPAAELAR